MKTFLFFALLLGIAPCSHSSRPNVSDLYVACTNVHGLQCNGHDIKNHGPVQTIEDCCKACQGLPGCKAWTWNRDHDKACWLKTECDSQRHDPAYDSGWLTPAPSPPPPAPTPPPSPPGPSPLNPLNIVPLPNREDNYFLIIGDWGVPRPASEWPYAQGGCQEKVAQMMKDYVNAQTQKGKKCLFIGAVGDNFYSTGVQDDAHWASQWGNVYGTNDGDSPLKDIPWLAVMGNHDLGNADPACACGQGCKQFNGQHRPSSTDKFWMPDYYWSYFIPGVDLEIIGIDTNAIDVSGIGGNGAQGGAVKTFQRCGGQGNVQSFLDGRKAAGEAHLDERARASTAKTVLIMQHYDGGLGATYKQRFEQNNGKARVLSAYGHTHDQVCYHSEASVCDDILTGGGGGWRGGAYFGFTAVHFTNDGGFRTTLDPGQETTRFPQNSCAYAWHDELSEQASTNTSKHASIKDQDNEVLV